VFAYFSVFNICNKPLVIDVFSPALFHSSLFCHW